MDFLKPAPARPIVLGNMSEVTALTPIRWGRVPGERRTYE